MMCLNSTCFCVSAKDAVSIILDNASTMAVISFMEELVIGLGKILTVVGCVALGWALMHYESLAPEVTTRILPLVVIALCTYFISAAFFSVYTVCIDAAFICYHHDLKINAASGRYFVPAELQDLVSGLTGKREAAALLSEPLLATEMVAQPLVTEVEVEL